jgi:transcriptional/translational regulatory protein YebC/TACO1
MLSIVLDAGAEDLRDDGSSWEVVTPPESFEPVREALAKAGIKPASAEVGWVPQNYVKLSGPQAAQMLRLVEALEEHDDVQHVFANFDIDEKEIQAVMAAG